MTTAARPTWDTAKGGTQTKERELSSLTKQYSSRDLPSQTSLKRRHEGQGTEEEHAGRDFRRELEERERVTNAGKDGKVRAKDRAEAFLAEAAAVAKNIDEAQDALPPPKKSRGGGGGGGEPANLDADDPLDDSDDDSDDDDDTALLMAELQKIKKEKEEDERQKDEERKEEEERIRMENILSGNPLLRDKFAASASKAERGAGGMKIKKRWDDDVVFKNCSRAEPDKKEKAFINDSLRNEFHKKFMTKYIK